MNNEKFAHLSYSNDGSYWLHLSPDVKQSKICLSCAYISQSFSSNFQVVPCLVLSDIFHSEKYLFCCLESCSISIQRSHSTGPGVAVSVLLHWKDPFEIWGRKCSFHFSFFPLLSEKWKEWYSNRTSVFWLLFYYLDILELLWAMIWEFPGARLQLFPLYHLHFSKCHRLLLQPYRKSQGCHSLRTDWWCFQSCGLKKV